MLNIFPIAARAVSVLAEPVTVRRRVQNIADDGRVGPLDITEIVISAVIVAEPPNTLDRPPEYQYAPQTIELWTTYPVQGPVPGYQPDEIIWHGDVYVVTGTLDRSKNGQGSVQVYAQSRNAIDGPPLVP